MKAIEIKDSVPKWTEGLTFVDFRSFKNKDVEIEKAETYEKADDDGSVQQRIWLKLRVICHPDADWVYSNTSSKAVVANLGNPEVQEILKTDTVAIYLFERTSKAGLPYMAVGQYVPQEQLPKGSRDRK